MWRPIDDAESQLEGSRFVIQRHDARRLHYDFRLEHDGVLVSWALPKGVPTDPGVNHLAVPTEDHPMSYRHFEGEIPRGEYGAGTVRIWDSGVYELEKWRDDEVIVTLTGRPDGGLDGPRRFALFRTGEDGGKPRWMIHLMKPEGTSGPRPGHKVSDTRTRTRTTSRNGGAGAGADAPAYNPMLSESGDSAAFEHLDPAEWAFEMKWDGIRALARVDGERCALRSRSGADITLAYPELAAVPTAVNAECVVLDGEIVAFGDDGAPSFGRLQRRFGLTDKSEIARARREAPVVYLVFDVLSVNGSDCRALPYRQRRELLDAVVEEPGGAPVALPAVFAGSPDEARETSRQLHLEGIVAKRWESPYHSGARSADWLKFPLIRTSEAVVIGWRESPSETAGFASLLLATTADDGWQFAGRVGTGFTGAERRRLRTLLAPLACDSPPTEVPAEIRRDAHWVRPELVAEVASKGRTESGSFRQPVWRGLRPDKRPGDLRA